MDRVLSATIRLRDQFTQPLRNAAREQQVFNNAIEEARNNLQQAYDRAYNMNVQNGTAIRNIREVSEQSNLMNEGLNTQSTIRVNNDQATRSIRQIIEQSRTLNKPFEIVMQVKDYITRQTELIKEKLKAIGKILITPIVKIKDFATTQLSKVKSILLRVGRVVATPIIKVKDLAYRSIVKIYEKAKVLGRLIISPIIKIKDMASRGINKVKGLLDIIKATKTVQTIIRVKDMASNTINRVKGLLDRFKATQSYQTIIKAKDMATKVISTVSSKLKAFTGKTYSAIVKAKDMASGILGGLKSKLTALAGGITIAVAAKIGIEGLGTEQTQKLTITRVIENSGMGQDDAKKATEQYYSWIEDYANKTPFETQNVAMFGTKAMMIAQGDVQRAQQLTDAMGNIKAFVGDLRTEQEVAEAMFSGANGNLDMLNTMLGTTYETFDEALTGIQEKQGGLVEQMSSTLPGLMSTITGKLKTGLKNITKAFEPFISGAMAGMISGIDKYLPKVLDFFTKNAEGIVNTFKSSFGKIKNIVMPVFESIKKASSEVFKGDIASEFVNNIEVAFDKVGSVISGIASNSSIQSGIVNIANGFIAAGNMIIEVFNKITSNDSFIEFVNTIGESFSGIGEMMQNIFSDTTIVDTLSTIGTSFMDMVNMALPPIMDLINALGPVLRPVVETLGSIFETVFPLIGQIIQDVTPVITQLISDITPIINAVCEAVRFVFNAVAECWPMISEIISTAGQIISPILQTIGTLAGVIVNIFTTMWPSIKGVVEDVWGFIKPIFDWLGEKLQWVADKVSSVVSGFKNMKDAVSDAVSNTVDKVKNSNWNPFNWFGGDDGSHAYGLPRVPYDNYKAVLHEGEMVLTKQQAGQYEQVLQKSKAVEPVKNTYSVASIKNINDNRGYEYIQATKDSSDYSEITSKPFIVKGKNISDNRDIDRSNINDTSKNIKNDITISKIADTVVIREEADIDKIANAFVNKLNKVKINYGGA